MIEIRCRVEGEHVVLELEGELCAATSDPLDRALAAAMETDATRVVVDLAGVNVLSAHAQAVLVRFAHEAEAAGRSVRVRGATGVTASALDAGGLAWLVEDPPDTIVLTEGALAAAHWLTVVEVSDLLGVPIRRVYDLVATGDIDARRIGRATMIARTDVERVRALLSVAGGR